MVDLIGCVDSSDECLSIVNNADLEVEAVEKEKSDEQYYTQDWFSKETPVWDKYKTLFFNQENIRCLEIGSFEGRSTVYMLNNYCNGNNSHMDALDTWEGSVEHSSDKKDNLYSRFLNNTQKYIEGNKLEIYRDYSSNTLMKFVQELNKGTREKYDVIYVDASHIAKDVLLDAALAWKLLKTGGLMLFDDYEWSYYKNPEMNPKAGVDGFLSAHNNMYMMLHKGYQLHIMKDKDESF
jgi:predicted O-methyltransferase YrrM